jgi:hypothetical protein
MLVQDLGTNRDAELHNTRRIFALRLGAVLVGCRPRLQKMTARTPVVLTSLENMILELPCIEFGGGGLEQAIIRVQIRSLSQVYKNV